jgi:hypothetical protein
MSGSAPAFSALREDLSGSSLEECRNVLGLRASAPDELWRDPRKGRKSE